jgi:chromosome partitioning protein
MSLCIAVHSLRGGTGKTLISMNLAALLVTKGYRVVIIDMDLGAPSLQTYIDYNPEKRINDYFDNENIELDDIFFDGTDLIGTNVQGKLFISLANDKGKFISAMKDRDKQKSLDDLYKLIGLVREILPKDPWKADFIILDTSPGFSADSLNCVAAANHLILMLRLVNADLGGTGQMLETLHTGLKPVTSLILNQVPRSFVDEENDEYTKNLVKKHVIDPLKSDRINIAGLISNDIEVIEKEAEYSMYFLEGVKAKRPIHVMANPDGNLSKHMMAITDYIISLKG